MTEDVGMLPTESVTVYYQTNTGMKEKLIAILGLMAYNINKYI